MKSPAFGRLIAGPVGSGKTTGCIFEIFRRACEQTPAPDGKRYTRFAVLRQTLSQIKQTVLKDILAFFGPVAYWKVSDSTIHITAGDVRCEMVLIPLEDLEDQRRLLSMQLTSAFISEAIEIDINLIPAIAGRCGRYPSAAQGGCTHFGLIADTNMPAEGSPWHKFMVEPPADWEVFVQPGGLEELAENLNWLTQTEATLKLPIDDPARLAQGRKYYERLSRSESVDWVRRYVHAQYGDDPSGTAVFRESFKSSFHVVDTLEPIYGQPLLVGQDFGRDPCTIICQVDPHGRLLVLKEVIAESIGLELHIERAVRTILLSPQFMGRPVAMVGDPAGMAKSSLSEETSFDALKRMGFAAFPAPTNDIDPRIRAVDSWLLRQIDGKGAVQISREGCPTLVRALSGGYRYAKTKSGMRKPTPEKKHPWSDIVDAFQYVCLTAHGRMNELIGRHLMRKRPQGRVRPTAAAWT